MPQNGADNTIMDVDKDAIIDQDRSQTSLLVEAQQLGRRFWLSNRFKSHGLEVAYQIHKRDLWIHRCCAWSTSAALLLTLGAATVLVSELMDGSDFRFAPKPSLRLPFACWGIFLWGAAAFFRFAPREWLVSCARFRMAFLCFVAYGIVLSSVFPVLAINTGLGSTPFLPSDRLNDYARGHGHFAAAGTAIIFFAWSQMEPLMFSMHACIALIFWSLRNAKLQTVVIEMWHANGTANSHAEAPQAMGGVIHWSVILLIQWIPFVFTCTYVSYEKDSMMRDAFVALHFLDESKRAAIRKLQHEKQDLQRQKQELDRLTLQPVKLSEQTDDDTVKGNFSEHSGGRSSKLRASGVVPRAHPLARSSKTQSQIPQRISSPAHEDGDDGGFSGQTRSSNGSVGTNINRATSPGERRSAMREDRRLLSHEEAADARTEVGSITDVIEMHVLELRVATDTVHSTRNRPQPPTPILNAEALGAPQPALFRRPVPLRSQRSERSARPLASPVNGQPFEPTIKESAVADQSISERFRDLFVPPAVAARAESAGLRMPQMHRESLEA